MFMQKIEMAAVTCDLFSATKGFEGSGCGSIAPRAANENEARAYADFIRRKIGAPDLGKPRLQHKGGTGRLATSHFHYVGATYGEEISRGEYEPGAFSVLFPGANQMRAKVTLETLDDAGNVTGSLTMPVDPKKGGVVWSKDDVRKACGPIAKVKAPRAPTVVKRRAAPTVSQDKRRRAIMLALNLRKQLRREQWISRDQFKQIREMTRESIARARQMREDCAAPVSAPDAPATAPDAILSDLAAAEALMRGEGYVAPLPVMPEAAPTAIQASKRTPAHERAIRRAWAERKALRHVRDAYNASGDARRALVKERDDTLGRASRLQLKRRRAVLKAREVKQSARYFITQSLAHYDRAINAEHEAREALAARKDLQRILAAAEARLAAAEAENAQLWAEIEGLTAPVPALAT
jgi:hypothetical protein